ncbi:MAG: LysE family translocator [Psychromonas sp.]|nr:LysE family translocator [Psychromonas sp.]
MTVELLMGFSIIVVLGAILPGPNLLVITTNAVAFDKNTAFFTLLGTLSAFYVHGFFSLIGVSTLVHGSANAFTIFKLIGMAYLIYLGFTLLLQAFNKSNQVTTQSSNSIKPNKSYRSAWFQGFLTNLLNPKVSMFYLALFPQFLTDTSNIFVTTAFLVSLQVVIVGAWYGTIIMFTIKIGSKGSSKSLRFVKGAMGVAMLYFGFNLVQYQVRT